MIPGPRLSFNVQMKANCFNPRISTISYPECCSKMWYCWCSFITDIDLPAHPYLGQGRDGAFALPVCSGKDNIHNLEILSKMRTLKSEEVNFLIWRYLQESGFHHSSFTFGNEGAIDKSDINGRLIPPGSLIHFLQKGLQYLEIERKLQNSNKYNINYNSPFELLHPEIPADKLKMSREMTRRARQRKKRSMTPSELPTVDENRQRVHVYMKNDVTVLKGHEHEVFICAWSPNDPNVVASGSGDSTARIWNLPINQSGPEASKVASERPLLLPHSPIAPPNRDGTGPMIIRGDPLPDAPASSGEGTSKDVTTLDWSKDGVRLATGSYDGKARIWTKKGKLLSILDQHQGPIFSLKWNKTGQYLLSGSVDNSAIVWDIMNGKVRQQFFCHTAPTLDVDWKDEHTFATCSTDKTINVCQVGLDDPIKRFQGHNDEVNAIRWSPNGQLLASCSDDFSAKIWSMNNDTFVNDFKEHKKEIYTIKWSPTGANTAYPNRDLVLATASFDATIKIWDIERGRSIHNLTEHSDPVYSVAFSPDGKWLASGSFDSNLHIWDVNSGKLVRTYRGTGSIFEVCWNCNGQKVAACFSNSITENFSVSVIDVKM